MSAAGPELPPHLLAKRKRQQEQEDENEISRPSGAKRAKTPEADEKRARVIGPAAPPAPLDERPSEPPTGSVAPEDDQSEQESSDDDDDFGPALPTAQDATRNSEDAFAAEARARSPAATTEKQSTSKRDEWMMVPPKQDDLSTRMDPSKLRARGFNTGKAAKGPAQDVDSGIWTETPEQKRKRLQDEVMGVKSMSGSGPTVDVQAQKKRAEDRATAARLQEQRGQSLTERHMGTKGKDKEDDPSKRAFDREKDIGGGMMSNVERKNMLNKAKDFSSKFSGGSYL
ncbi:hypothetical protein MBLNU457_7799t1 [Dothideomycetes sp. NU457]